uniref:PAX-interacting protein 1-like n=1 Tax=Styela clava TaxID=7725 RepID=UPI001939F985|nr:PAX-interacting protein 1-like [Styela clava]
MTNEEEKDALFKNVRFYIIGKLDEKFEKLLIDGKAKQESYLSGLATHAIVSDFSNLEVEEARDVWQIPAVTAKWIELSFKCQKLLPMEPFTPSNSQLFSGLVICPSQLNKKDINLLWALVTFYGGSCQLMLNKTCTHLVVSQPKGAKYEEALKHPEVVTPVTLDWILDSVKDKKLSDVKEYHPSLVILPQEKPEITVTETSIPETQDSETNVISSSLQNLAVSKASEQVKTDVPQTTSISSINNEITSAIIHPSQVVPPTFSQSQPQLSQPGMQTGPSGGHLISSAPHMVSIPPDKFYPTGQTIISQPAGQQLIMTGQNMGQPQLMTMQQPFQMQRQISPGGTARFSVPNMQQRFTSPNQISNGPRQPSPSPKKAPKRRRSSTKSKANASAAATSVPPSPSHVTPMSMMSQQLLQQQNQMQLLHQHRIMQGQNAGAVKPNFLQQQQQIYQQQHFANMQQQGKPPGTPASPQKQGQQNIMGDQSGMRPGFPGNFAGNVMRMQQTRPMQVQTPLSPQQMMAMGFNPQHMQIQQQGIKMSMAGPQMPQQQQHQFVQSQGVVIPMSIQMQNQQSQPMNAGKLQPQRMQISPQPQGMFIHQQLPNKDGVSPRPPLQQHSPVKQLPGGVQQQPLTPQQQRQQQQMMMQQMVHQQQLQMQQQQQILQQSPGNLQQPQQKHATPPASHAPINVGIGVISPTALQQGLMMAQAQQNQGFQPPLIHPSLQTPQDYGKVTQQSGSAKSRRSKSRKPKDGDENNDAKPKPKPRSRPKKPSQSPASSNTSSPGSKKQNSQTIIGGRNEFSAMIRGPTPMGYYQTPLNVMTPPPHPTVPVSFSTNKQFSIPTATVSPLAATENTFSPGQVIMNQARMVLSPPPAPKVETHFLPQHIPVPTPPPPQRGPFADPLEMMPKSYEGRYFGHDSAENVPQDLCLLGCVFVIIEYQESVPDIKIIDHWKKVINKFGGIVEDEYNTCTCTHLLCISQSSSLFKDALLEGKRCVTVYWLNDVLQIRKLSPPWLSIHVPTPYPMNQKPAINHNMSYTGFHQKERERLRMMAGVSGCKFSGFLSRSNTVLVCKGTLSLKYDKAREWRIPCVNVHWLRDVMQGDTEALKDPGQEKYQNFDENSLDLFGLDESKMQKILDPWKVPVRVTLDCMQRARVKRKNSMSDSVTPALKRSRLEGSYQPLPRVCFTGLPAKQVTELQKTLESMQGQVSKTISLSTHLVAKSVSRTVKFLCAISVCQYIVTPEWIEESSKSNWLLDEDKYLLHDKAAEEKFEFSLKESISRARKNPLFKGYVFCITDNVAPDRKILTEIIECAGGKVVEKIPTIQTIKRVKDRKPPNNRLLLVSCPADKNQVIKWKREGIQVHNAEIILSGVLKQEVNESLYQL